MLCCVQSEHPVLSSSFSSASASSSLRDVDALGSRLNAETDLQLIMLSEKFQHCLRVIERSTVGNIFQPKLAAYRQLPLLEGKLLHFSLEELSKWWSTWINTVLILIDDCVRPRWSAEAWHHGAKEGGFRKLYVSSSGASVGFSVRAEQRTQCQQHGVEQEEPGNRHKAAAVILSLCVCWNVSVPAASSERCRCLVGVLLFHTCWFTTAWTSALISCPCITCLSDGFRTYNI